MLWPKDTVCKLILPQLGTAGVATHEVKKRSGFKVEYGPVQADVFSMDSNFGHPLIGGRAPTLS